MTRIGMSDTKHTTTAPRNKAGERPDSSNGPGVESRHTKAALPEWAGRIFAACIGITVVCGLAVGRWLYNETPPRGEALAANSVHVDAAKRFKLRLHGSGWHKVEAGTHSKGSTEVEFDLAEHDAYVIVFTSDKERSMESHSSWRIERFLDKNTHAKCTEQRALQADTLHLVSTIRCQGTTKSGRQLVKHYRSINANGNWAEAIGRSYVSGADPGGAAIINQIMTSFEIP